MCKSKLNYLTSLNLEKYCNKLIECHGYCESRVLSILLNVFFFIVRLQLSQFSPIALICAPPPTVSPHPVVFVHGSFIPVCWLDPSPSFLRYPPTPSPALSLSVCETWLIQCYYIRKWVLVYLSLRACLPVGTIIVLSKEISNLFSYDFPMALRKLYIKKRTYHANFLKFEYKYYIK